MNAHFGSGEQPFLSVRDIAPNDFEKIADYWLQPDTAYLVSLGVDIAKLPSRVEFIQMLADQYALPLIAKQSYCKIWAVNEVPVGHCNINNITVGEQAWMHLHFWKKALQGKGWGSKLLLRTIPYFFREYQLQVLYCEPYALNAPPHKTLSKLGFTLLKEYVYTPGNICFEQPVKQWMLTREVFAERWLGMNNGAAL